MISNNSALTRQEKQKSQQSKESRDTFGDKIKRKKNSNTLRVVFQNVNGLMPKDNEDKRELIRDFINDYKVDIFMMAEVNVNWKIVGKKHDLRSITKKWYKDSRVAVAHNLLGGSKSSHQPGGVSSIITGNLSASVVKSYYDGRMMGRWCSSTIRGSNNSITRVVTVYVPCNSKTHGCKTVFSQQQAALLKSKVGKGVLKRFWLDFWDEIDGWRKNGEKLIVGGDWNRNIVENQMLDEFKSKGLIPVVATKFPDNIPETYSGGSYPIDEIFVSETLEIKACGYMEHGLNRSDHRPIWLDIEKQEILGYKPPALHKHSIRRLQMYDPRVVSKYNTILEHEFEQYDIYKRSMDLYNAFQGELTPAQCAEYDLLDRDRIAAMRTAERSCRKLHMGAIAWSPAIQKSKTTILYITLTMRRKVGRNVSARYLMRLSKKLGINLEHMTVYQLQEERSRVRKIYNKQKKEASKLGLTYLESLAEALEEAGKGKKAKIIQQIIKTEAQKTSYKKLSKLNKKKDANLSTTAITMNLPDGSKKEITEKAAMEKAIINENIKKFHQSEDTCPFLQGDLRQQMGEYGETVEVERVLDGMYTCPSTNNNLTPLFIETCKRQCEENPMTRTPLQFKKSWQRMREKTASHDIHFGHFQAACEHKENLLVHYIMAEIPMRTGFCPSRWRNATNVMILKKAGLFDLDKLRTLCLFQADHNHNNKFLGKEMMSHALKNSCIAPEQYSVTGKKAISHALNKTLLFDNIRYNKGCLSLTSCDLKSCYDRIVHNPAMLALRSCGVPKQPLISFFSSLQNVKYYTRTAFGISDETFGGIEKGFTQKPQGSGQGNGAAPQIWAIVSSKMFAMLHELGLASVIKAPISGTSLWLVGFAYVDDSDLFTYSKSHDVEETVKKMQCIVTAWERAAKVTGGAIAPLKCWWYLVTFQWNKHGEWRYGKAQENEIKMLAKDADEKLHEIKRLDCSEAQEMLGVHIAPDGSSKAQLKVLTEKARDYAERLRICHTYRHEAWLGLTTIATKSIEYCLPATTLSEKECDSIMWILLKEFLPRSGVNRFVKRDVLYAPISLQGLGLKNLYMTQGLNHVCDIIEHTWKDSITGNFINVSLESLRLEIGTNDCILQSNISTFAEILLTHSWIRHTWQFMSENHITMDINTKTVPSQRENDKEIMKEILRNRNLTAYEKREFNKCRIYLKLFHLSDMVTGDGQKIRDSVWKGEQPVYNINTEVSWPKWGKPSTEQWRIWRYVLRSTFCRHKEKVLDTPLGKWLSLPPQ